MRRRAKGSKSRVEYWQAVSETEPDWADRPGSDWEDPEYMAWVESWTKDDIKELAKAVVEVSEKRSRKRR